MKRIVPVSLPSRNIDVVQLVEEVNRVIRQFNEILAEKDEEIVKLKDELQNVKKG